MQAHDVQVVLVSRELHFILYLDYKIKWWERADMSWGRTFFFVSETPNNKNRCRNWDRINVFCVIAADHVSRRWGTKTNTANYSTQRYPVGPVMLITQDSPKFRCCARKRAVSLSCPLQATKYVSQTGSLQFKLNLKSCTVTVETAKRLPTNFQQVDRK